MSVAELSDVQSERLPVVSAGQARDASCTACSKAIIVGEHAVVYGARAVAIPVLSMNIVLRLTKLRDGDDRVKLALDGRPVSDQLAGVVPEAMKLLGIKPFGMTIEGSSNVLIGAGLGSSASLCVGVIRALASSLDLPMTTTECALYANELEKRFHGNPSGLDTAVVATEQAISFRRGETPRPLNVTSIKSTDGRGKWSFALIDTGLRASTYSMIQVAKPFFTGSQGVDRVALFDELASRVEQGLELGDADAVGQAMNVAGDLFVEAGVAGSQIQEIVKSARNLNVLGAKVTGAGGGGCVLALLDPTRAAEQMDELMRSLSGLRVIKVDLN